MTTLLDSVRRPRLDQGFATGTRALLSNECLWLGLRPVAHIRADGGGNRQRVACRGIAQWGPAWAT